MQTRRFATFCTRALAHATHRAFRPPYGVFIVQIEIKNPQENIIRELVDRRLAYTAEVSSH
jgi:hypothetical protein